MSQENVEIVQRLFEAFQAGVERGDFSAAWETGAIATDVEWCVANGLEQGTFRGRDGFAEFMRAWTEDFDGWSAQLLRLVDAGDHGVLAYLHQSATGKLSGVPVEQDYAIVYELEEGQLVRLLSFDDLDQAREAAGLSE